MQCLGDELQIGIDSVFGAELIEQRSHVVHGEVTPELADGSAAGNGTDEGQGALPSLFAVVPRACWTFQYVRATGGRSLFAAFLPSLVLIGPPHAAMEPASTAAMAIPAIRRLMVSHLLGHRRSGPGRSS